jgi:nucleoside-diphosphate-sugar epimerase
MKILVTGAGGVLGRNLVAVLRASNHTVFAAARQPVPNANVRWDVNLHDVPDPEPHVETVVHAAARRGHYGGELTDADVLFQTNVFGTLRVVEWCSARNVERLILISGAIVYGQWHARPKTETDRPAPWAAGPYAASKYCSEVAAMLLSQLGCKLTVLRLSSLYGPEYRTSLIHRLLHQGRSEGRIVLSPPVDDAFDLLHVDDAVQTIVTAVQQPRDGVFNVGGGGTVTLHELATLCAEATSATLEIRAEAQPRPPRTINWVDDARARRHFGHTNRIAVRKGVASLAARERGRDLEPCDAPR